MSRTYDEYDQDRPLAKGALTRFLMVQDRIAAILADRLETWHQAEHGQGTPYGSRLVSVDWDGLHYEVQSRDDWWPTSRFTVPLDILTDPDFEAACAAKGAARTAADAAQKAARTAQEARDQEARDQREYARLSAKYAPTIERSTQP